MISVLTENGSFIVNGAERVIVSQMVRSPGVYYDFTRDKFGKQLFTSQIIPNRGAWIEYECDANDVCWARLDRTRKVPVTVLLRSLGLSSDDDIFETFGEENYLNEEEMNNLKDLTNMFLVFAEDEECNMERNA